MSHQIREATEEDRESIVNILKVVWDEQICDKGFQKQVNRNQSVLLVAEVAGKVVGFCSAFLGDCDAVTSPWEVDYISILPECRGRGIGKDLIRHVLGYAVEYNATISRAYIEIANIASKKAFLHNGFQESENEYVLIFWNPCKTEREAKHDTKYETIVDTLNYRGIWLKNIDPSKLQPHEITKIVENARHVANESDCDRVGLMLDSRFFEEMPENLMSEAEVIGTYRMWSKRSSL